MILLVAAGPGALPTDLTPWGMFLAADIVVKLVIVGLVVASVVTWTIFFAKSAELRGARRQAREAVSEVESVTSITEAAARLGKTGGAPSWLADAVATERSRSSAAGATSPEGVKERAVSRLDRVQAAAVRRMNAGVGVLGTISNTAPFVGLFGTVWGIMNAFIGIAESQTTNLAVVAPGIAEALLATALGLVAAIPAAVLYNHFSRAIGGWRLMLGDVSAALLRLLSLELDAPGARR